MTVKIARDALLADSGVRNLVADRIGPVEEMQGQSFPYVVLALEKLEPLNTLSGPAGLDRGHVALDAWGMKYADAVKVANACRTALQNAGHVCTSNVADQFHFQQDSGVYRCGFTFQIWSS